jgi:hypothetical protein
LTPASEASSPLDLGSSDDFKLEVPEDGVALVDESDAVRQGPLSGISLDNPADSGISLEQSGAAAADESEYELTLDDAPESKPSTPKPASGKLVETEESDSSEFELSLDVDKTGAPPDSDSEFELTLDDSGGLAAEEEPVAEEGQEQDIFETDLDVPALDGESGSDQVEVEEHDTDLESPDFELAIGDEDVAAAEESGSEVVALDDEEAVVEVDDEAATVQTKRRGKRRGLVADEEEAGEFGDLEDLEEQAVLGDDDVEVVVGEAVVMKEAPWGIMPVVVLFPCVVVMLLLGMMGFELVQTQQGYKPGVVTKMIGGLTGAKK